MEKIREASSVLPNLCYGHSQSSKETDLGTRRDGHKVILICLEREREREKGELRCERMKMKEKRRDINL